MLNSLLDKAENCDYDPDPLERGASEWMFVVAQDSFLKSAVKEDTWVNSFLPSCVELGAIKMAVDPFYSFGYIRSVFS